VIFRYVENPVHRFLCLLFLVLPSPASAVIISGQITGGGSFSNGGSFIELLDLDNLIIGGDRYNDYNLRAFNERQNVVSDEVIQTDIGRDVAAGEVVASHYILYDPRTSSNVKGTLTFDAPIIGVATSDSMIYGSDFLMNGTVTYEHVKARGLEGGDSITLFDDDPYRLDLALWASSPGDFIRVFTETSQLAVERGISEFATPLPSAAALLPVGFGIYAFSRRAFGARRKKKPAF